VELTRNFIALTLPARGRPFGPGPGEKFLAPRGRFCYYNFLKYSKALLSVIGKRTLLSGEKERKERENDF
jgi:hypothetical protein